MAKDYKCPHCDELGTPDRRFWHDDPAEHPNTCCQSCAPSIIAHARLHIAEAWCSECDEPSVDDERALCVEHMLQNRERAAWRDAWHGSADR